MLKKTPLSIALIVMLTYCLNTPSVWGQINPAINTTLRAKMPFTGNQLSNICGYAQNGREYALVGNQQGTTIVDVTNPSAPFRIKHIDALRSIWREIKVYKNFMYITTEANGQGLQIVNMTALPDSNIVFKSVKHDSINGLLNIARIHALHIDTAKGMLYGFGGVSIIKNGDTTINVSGAVILDIKTDPYNPKYVGFYNKRYIHDGYVNNDTLYAAEINQGLMTAIDCRDKRNPVEISKVVTPTAFTHNTWPANNGTTILTTDENSGSYLAAYNMSNPAAPKLLDKIRSTGEDTVVVHNTHVVNNFAVSSWYTEGITIVDVSRPTNLVQVGQYDTYPAKSGGYNGCWGVYPFLPSGNLVLSDMQNGLFVVTPQYKRACYLEGKTIDSLTRQPLQNVSVKINSTDIPKKIVSNLLGNYATGQVTSGSFSVTYSLAGYHTKTVNVSLQTGLVTTQNVELQKLGVSTTETIVDAWNIQISPNPFNQFLSVNFQLDNQVKAAKLLIFNVLGQLVEVKNLQNTEGGILVASTLSSGLYFLKIEDTEGRLSRTFRVSKQ